MGSAMKLSEALSERSEYVRKMQELRERIVRNSKHQEGEKPTENPERLLEEFESISLECCDLIVRINMTNNSISLDSGLVLTEALAKRDQLKSMHSLLKTLATEATPKQDRYSKKEIKFVSSVNVSQIQSRADDLAKEFRNLDSQIQQANWTYDLK